MKSKLLVSACLMGFQVRYNGSEKAQLAATLSRWQPVSYTHLDVYKRQLPRDRGIPGRPACIPQTRLPAGS